MRMLSGEESLFFDETKDQLGIEFVISHRALGKITIAVANQLPQKCHAIIAGGFPRDCLLRDGEWSDVDIFVFPVWQNDESLKFSHLEQVLLSHPSLSLGLLREYNVKFNAISYSLYLYVEGESLPLHSRLYKLIPCSTLKLIPCSTLKRVAVGSDGFPLAFRGEPNGAISNFNIMLRDETSAGAILRDFPINLSKAYIPLFPTIPEVQTTLDFDLGVRRKTITVEKIANINASDEVRLQNYLDKIREKFPNYSTTVIDVCPF